MLKLWSLKRMSRPAADWPMQSSGPALFNLAQRAFRAPSLLSVSPASRPTQAFVSELAELRSDLEASNGAPNRILSIGARLDEIIAEFGKWQTTEVERTIESMVQVLKVVADSLGDSIEELDGAQSDLQALTSALEQADKAGSLDEVRAALQGQSERVIKLQEVQFRQRKRFEKKLEDTVQALQSELATALRDSQKDPLTGALNRSGFETRFSQTKMELQGSPWSLAMLDLDGFKGLNDSLGHVAGDAALKFFREALSEAIPCATIARFGGDEFVLLVPVQPEALRVTLAKFRAKLPKKECQTEGPNGRQTMRLATSFGVTKLASGDTPETAISRADAELYEMKRQFSPGRAA